MSALNVGSPVLRRDSRASAGSVSAGRRGRAGGPGARGLPARRAAPTRTRTRGSGSLRTSQPSRSRRKAGGGQTRTPGGAGRGARRSAGPPRREAQSRASELNKSSGAQRRPANAAFTTGGFPKIPPGFGGAGTGDSRTEGASSWDDTVLGWWGDPGGLSVSFSLCSGY